MIDAVVAWGCNDDIFAPWNGPDNLRFLFLAPTNQTASPGSAPEGLETMRITPWGHVGIGSGFSNALQPVRRLDVFDSNSETPQFRISHDLNNNPNPFTSSTLITYRLPKATFARLRVVNTSGQTIEVLTEGQQSEGEYRVVWNGDHLAPGTYIYILEADGVEIAKRAIKMN